MNERKLNNETLKKFLVGADGEKFHDDESDKLKLLDSICFPLFMQNEK